MLDCGYAACKLTVGKLREAAATVGSDILKADLLFVADKLESPEELDKCAGAVQADLLEEAGDGDGDGEVWTVYDLWGGPSNSGPNHLRSVQLHALCDLDDPTTYTVDDPPTECTASINTDEFAEAPVEPSISSSAVTFYGPYAEGTSNISNVSYSVSNPGCTTPPCAMSVTQLDMDAASVQLGSFSVSGVSLSLASTAAGTIDGTSVSIPAGGLVFDVEFKVKVNGDYLLGTSPFTLEFATKGVTTATLDGTGAFEIERAEFGVGGETAILNTE